jgi:Regulator of chromosome condensation (RCC1) repeat
MLACSGTANQIFCHSSINTFVTHFSEKQFVMSGQRSADDAGDNLGNDGSDITNHRSGNNNVNGGGNGDTEEHMHHNNVRRRNDSTASGMAGGCSMREGADSIELRGDGSSGTSNNSAIHGNHYSSRPQRIHPNAGNTTTTNTSTNDGLAVFTWGRGEDGQLGLGDTADQDEPTYVCCYYCLIKLINFYSFLIGSVQLTSNNHLFILIYD